MHDAIHAGSDGNGGLTLFETSDCACEGGSYGVVCDAKSHFVDCVVARG